MQITEIFYAQAQAKRREAQINRPENSFHKCAYPNCSEKARWDSYCWFHYQEEHYTSR